MKKFIITTSLLLIAQLALYAQRLQPGFDKGEYIEVLRVNSKTAGNVSYNKDIPFPTTYDTANKINSPIVGFDNKWEIWLHKDRKQFVISFRGSTAKMESWLANAYAAMLPATGTVQLDKKTTYNYQLAVHPQAYIHSGWLISYGYLSQSLLPTIDSLIQQGYHDIIVSGHSQGGALAYMCGADLRIKQQKQIINPNVNIKVLCGAAPKPGNLYFAYDYEKNTPQGWAYNVVNTVDWVPEMPFTVQTVNDVNALSPFAIAKPMIKKLPFSKRIIMNYAYNSIDKPLRKANKKINNMLGKRISGIATKTQPELVTDTKYQYTTNYSRAGAYILLYPDSGYYSKFTDTSNVFLHHMSQSYFYLLENDLFY